MKRVFVIVLLCITSLCFGQEYNLDFERNDKIGVLPKDWFRMGAADTFYQIVLDSIAHQQGRYAVHVKSTDKVDANAQVFGSIGYIIPAIYQGKEITLKAFMKTRNVSKPIGLMLRIDGQDGVLQFDNMMQKGITGNEDWTEYAVTLPLPEEATNIIVGFLLMGTGELWADNLRLTIDGKDILDALRKETKVFAADADTTEFKTSSGVKTFVPSKQQIANLNILGKIWGFLKYHHPAIGEGNYNWDYELFRILPDYINVKNSVERDKMLLAWMKKYGDIPRCEDCQDTVENVFLKPDLSWINKSDLNQEVKTSLLHIYENRHQGRHYYIRLAPNIGNPEFLNEKLYADMPYPDAGFRLLTLYKYWNMIQYFFPYRYLIEKDWNSIMPEYIGRFVTADNELEYELAALELIGDIQDTHANIWSGGDKIQKWKGQRYAPVHVRFIENKLVVTDYYNWELKDIVGLQMGDIITHINKKDVSAIIKDQQKYYPASNQAARLRDISADMLRSNDTELTIRYISDGKKKEKKIPLYDKDSLKIYRWYRPSEETSYKFITDDIGYVTLETISENDINSLKEVFKDTKGIIIDARNYPAAFVPFSLGSYFASTATPFVKFTAGNINTPGEFSFTNPISIPGTVPSYAGRLVIIVNEFTQSQAEYTSMAFKATGNAIVIGSQTAGADGNISAINLPGGLKTFISGIGVYYPDGGETQKIGIVPDIEIKPTIKSIIEGRDIVLGKSIEWINNN